MKTNFLATNTNHPRIMAEPDAEKRTRLYVELLLQPWGQMMSAFAGQAGGRP